MEPRMRVTPWVYRWHQAARKLELNARVISPSLVQVSGRGDQRTTIEKAIGKMGVLW